MARYLMRTEMISQDLAAAIKFYCYDNLTEFWRRNLQDTNLSSGRFLQIIRGMPASARELELISLIATEQGIDAGPRAVSAGEHVREQARKLCREVDRLRESTSFETIAMVLEQGMKTRRALGEISRKDLKNNNVSNFT